MTLTGRDSGGVEWGWGGAGRGEAVRLVVDLEAERADVLTRRTRGGRRDGKMAAPAWD